MSSVKKESWFELKMNEFKIHFTSVLNISYTLLFQDNVSKQYGNPLPASPRQQNWNFSNIPSKMIYFLSENMLPFQREYEI